MSESRITGREVYTLPPRPDWTEATVSTTGWVVIGYDVDAVTDAARIQDSHPGLKITLLEPGPHEGTMMCTLEGPRRVVLAVLQGPWGWDLAGAVRTLVDPVTVDNGDLMCGCGNRPDLEGWETCTAAGDLVEPTIGSGWDGHYVCRVCSIIARYVDGVVEVLP